MGKVRLVGDKENFGSMGMGVSVVLAMSTRTLRRTTSRASWRIWPGVAWFTASSSGCSLILAVVPSNASCAWRAEANWLTSAVTRAGSGTHPNWIAWLRSSRSWSQCAKEPGKTAEGPKVFVMKRRESLTACACCSSSGVIVSSESTKNTQTGMNSICRIVGGLPGDDPIGAGRQRIAA